MGGREGIYIGISRSDLFGYIGGACPPPGIVPAVDFFMKHKGSMTEQNLKLKILLIYLIFYLLLEGTVMVLLVLSQRNNMSYLIKMDATMLFK